ncbi:haloacid dehalogenase-like hydrolase [Candidatus Gracilibacteria bacterium]|nr:haloacid dehalogenase-like hydrolase [Candidatus Gracilibacteria bacterium]
MNSLFTDPLIHIKDKDTVKRKISKFSLDKLQIVSDFDSTITQDNGHTSWSLFSKSGLMPDEYIKERDDYFKYYYPFEIDATLSFEKKDFLMREWWTKHLELFIKYKLNINIIDKIIQKDSFVDFRHGMKEFMDISATLNIPFIILSAGITNTINEFLSYKEAQFDNIHIVSNELKFDNDGFCVGINKDIIIHSENKDEHDMPAHIQEMVKGKTDIILLGDSLTDTKMIDEELREGALKIGFLAEMKNHSKDKFMDSFDIVIASNYDSLRVPEMVLELIK